MTSARSYINWVKEAGRGKLTAILSWTCFTVLAGTMFVRLQIDELYTFFGIGNNPALLCVCAGLGLVIGFLEFFYLLQGKKQDFYFSLPVTKHVVFVGRYIHGLIHGLAPLICYMLVCGIYQSSFDSLFMKYSAGYTLQSILVYGAVYLLFYHIAMFAVNACGRLISAVCMTGAILVYFQIFFRGVCLVFAKQFYETFFASPLLEMLEIRLSPWRLAYFLCGGQLYDKFEILEYTVSIPLLVTAFVWIAGLGAAGGLIQRKRKVENTGSIFASPLTERVSEILLSVLAGLSGSSFLLSVTDGTKGLGKLVIPVVVLVGIIVAAAVHGLTEWIVQRPVGVVFAGRKKQLAAECSAVTLIVCALTGIAGAYDSYMPKDDEVKSLKIALAGVDMDAAAYGEMTGKNGQFLTESYLKKYELKGEGKEAGMRWLRARQSAKEVFSAVTVCFECANGREIYRSYPVDKEAFLAFGEVYESEEYKQLAYPLYEAETEQVEYARFTWYDGISEQTLHLSEEEKAEFVTLYREDVKQLAMAQLKEALPAGNVEITSEVYGRKISAVVYPFFENSCRFLKEHGADTEKKLSDYPVEAVSVTEWLNSASSDSLVSGTAMRKERYDTEADIKAWTARLIPAEFCIQPLLCPVDVSPEIEAEVREADSGALVTVDCYQQSE